MVKRSDLMLRTCVPPLCAALGLVLTACSPQGSDFMPSSHAPAPPTRSMQSATAGPIAARRASTLISMPVQSQAGQPLGAIEDIVFDAQGHVTDVVVNCAGKLVAVPWRIAVSRMHDGILVLNKERLNGAPSFAPDAWPDVSNPSWSASADSYWTTPIDSPSRARGRRPR